MKLEVKKYKIFSEITGSLLPFYKNDEYKDFNLKRFFFIYGRKKFLRADHAHKKCNQILIPISGEMVVEIISKKNLKKKYTLSKKNKKYLKVPKYNWIKIKFKDNDGILLILCDYKYDKKEYIQNIKEFFNLRHK
jgi:dTDP-4-dehydrorhamnose 3,5-epimerase-like enzyme